MTYLGTGPHRITPTGRRHSAGRLVLGVDRLRSDGYDLVKAVNSARKRARINDRDMVQLRRLCKHYAQQTTWLLRYCRFGGDTLRSLASQIWLLRRSLKLWRITPRITS